MRMQAFFDLFSILFNFLVSLFSVFSVVTCGIFNKNIILISGSLCIVNYIIQSIRLLGDDLLAFAQRRQLKNVLIFALIVSAIGLVVSFFIEHSAFYCICFALSFETAVGTLIIMISTSRR